MNDKDFEKLTLSIRQAGEIRAAQMASFARQTPINALVTLAASGLTAGVLWLEADRGWVAAWWVGSWTVPRPSRVTRPSR